MVRLGSVSFSREESAPWSIISVSHIYDWPKLSYCMTIFSQRVVVRNKLNNHNLRTVGQWPKIPGLSHPSASRRWTRRPRRERAANGHRQRRHLPARTRDESGKRQRPLRRERSLDHHAGLGHGGRRHRANALRRLRRRLRDHHQRLRLETSGLTHKTTERKRDLCFVAQNNDIHSRVDGFKSWPKKIVFYTIVTLITSQLGGGAVTKWSKVLLQSGEKINKT